MLVDTAPIVSNGGILVGGKDRGGHDKNLEETLARLYEVGMHVNREKFQLAKKHDIFLGFDIHAH